VYPGEIWFLRGPSGVGKTLLLRAVACLDPLEVRLAVCGGIA
jgi:ABC-type iron transport system FetAB ATPase subunit